MDSNITTIKGSCHCRNIQFDLVWPGPITEIPVRQCGCDFCRKRVGSWTSHPRAELSARIEQLSAVSKYRFGTKTAEFYVCGVCGVVPFVTSEIDDVTYAVVNVNSFDDVDVSRLSCSPTDFDGEEVNNRLDRRKRNWIGKVQVAD